MHIAVIHQKIWFMCKLLLEQIITESSIFAKSNKVVHLVSNLSNCSCFIGVIEGVWSCWSAWSSCSRGQKSRTRSCNNPAPRNGGRNCIGETIERKSCEDPDLEHLK